MIDNVVGYDGERYLHVFRCVHGRVEVKIFNVCSEECCIGCGEDTIEKYFGGGEVSHRSADVSRVVDEITSNC